MRNREEVRIASLKDMSFLAGSQNLLIRRSASAKARLIESFHPGAAADKSPANGFRMNDFQSIRQILSTAASTEGQEYRERKRLRDMAEARPRISGGNPGTAAEPMEFCPSDSQ
jgi:hypothetical protein